MDSLAYILLAICGLTAAVFACWRLASGRWSLPCPSWLHVLVEMDNPFAPACKASEIVARLGLEPGMRVLDAGCGPGRVTIPLARAVGASGRVTAMDIQPGMLGRVREKQLAAGLGNIECLQAGLGQGGLARERFDRAVLVTVLGEIPGRREAMLELYDALRPGGILSVSEMIFDPHFQSRSTLLGLGKQAGFREGAFHGNRFAYTQQLVKPA
jgi:ubiquinone/menaquinone biosynthesis C-methylase UbiE